MFDAEPHMTVRRASNAAAVSYGSAHRILRKDLKFHPCKLQLVQELLPTDHAARLTFAQGQLAATEQDSTLLENLFFIAFAFVFLIYAKRKTAITNNLALRHAYLPS